MVWKRSCHTHDCVAEEDDWRLVNKCSKSVSAAGVCHHCWWHTRQRCLEPELRNQIICKYIFCEKQLSQAKHVLHSHPLAVGWKCLEFVWCRGKWAKTASPIAEQYVENKSQANMKGEHSIKWKHNIKPCSSFTQQKWEHNTTGDGQWRTQNIHIAEKNIYKQILTVKTDKNRWNI